MNRIMKLGEVYANPKGYNANGRGSVYDVNGIVSTLVTMIEMAANL